MAVKSIHIFYIMAHKDIFSVRDALSGLLEKSCTVNFVGHEFVTQLALWDGRRRTVVCKVKGQKLVRDERKRGF